jgi:hypothetical protein
MHPTCRGRRRARDTANSSHGTRDAFHQGMKPVLFIVFLALGPAIADQLAVVPPAYVDAMAAPVAALGTTAANRSAIARATTPSARALLCGSGS